MRRLQLIELEDQPWLPTPIRDGATDYLQFVLERTRPYRAIVPRLSRALAETRSERVIDLCSGAGGPWLTLLPELEAAMPAPLEVRLTDRYPNLGAWERLEQESGGRIRGEAVPVDATRVPPDLVGFRTLFTSFHHFPPDQALQILQSAVQGGQGIAVFEFTERRALPAAGMLLVPLMVLLVTPAIRPFRWSRLLWTYLLPAVPLVGLFDGLVSCLRSYTPDELREMTARFSGYRWEIGQECAPGLLSSVTYLIGYPSAA